MHSLFIGFYKPDKIEIKTPLSISTLVLTVSWSPVVPTPHPLSHPENQWQLLAVGLPSAHCKSVTRCNDREAAKKHSRLPFPSHWFSHVLYSKYFYVRAYAINNLRTIKNSKYFSICSFTSSLASFCWLT